jgi:probable F420-dependent oxidoreductase
METTPRLSMGLRTFSAEDPGSWEPVLARAELYDRCGVDRLVVSDHVVFGEAMDAYGRPEVGGTAGGRQPTGPDGHWLEPLTALSFVAARTRRIRLGTNILLAALRTPVVLAKTAATIDVLSGGRLDLGVGVGWQREEYEAAGLSFEERGARLDHTLEVCRTLWTEQRATLRIDGGAVEGIHQMPKPVGSGGVPVWVSGTVNRRVARRLARFGSGWIPWGDAARDVGAGIVAMRRAVADAGGDPDGFGVVGNLPTVKDDGGRPDAAATAAGAPALVEAGVTDLRSGFPVPTDPAEAEDVLSGLVAAVRAAVGRNDGP